MPIIPEMSIIPENEKMRKWGASYKKSTSGGIVSLFNFGKV